MLGSLGMTNKNKRFEVSHLLCGRAHLVQQLYLRLQGLLAAGEFVGALLHLLAGFRRRFGDEVGIGESSLMLL